MNLAASNGPAASTRHTGWYGWLAVLLAATVIQTWWVQQSHRDPVFQVPLVDAARYERQARGLDTTEIGQPYWQPPLYAWVLRSIVRLAEPGSLRTTRLLHIPLGVLLVWLGGLLAGRIGGRRTGLITAALLAINGPLLFYSTQLLPSALATILFTAAILSTLHTLDHPSPRRALGTGLIFGLLGLTVPNLLLTVPVPLAGLWLKGRASGHHRESAMHAGLLMAGIVLCILPVTIRNRMVSGEWVPVSVNGGINLFVGNNPDLHATLAIRPGMEWDRLLRRPYDTGIRTPAQADRWFIQQVTDYLRTRPGQFLANLAWKIRLVWHGTEWPRNLSLYDYRPHAPLLKPLVWTWHGFGFPFGILAPCALAGLFIAWRNRTPGTGTLAAFLLTGTLAIALFIPADRYRLPLVPLVSGLAVLALDHLIRQFRTQRPRAIRMIAGLAVITVLLNLPAGFPAVAVPSHAELLMLTGVGFHTRGSNATATACYQQALDEDPDLADAWYYLSAIERAAGRLDLAADHLQTCLAGRPDHERALHDLGVLRTDQGQYDAAIPLFEQVLELNPRNTRAMSNLATAKARQGKLDEAAYWLRKAGIMPAGAQLEPVKDRDTFRIVLPR